MTVPEVCELLQVGRNAVHGFSPTGGPGLR
jgi:hypothetical protein